MRLTPAGVKGGLSAAERVIPPLRRLPARWRMTMRGITRNRRRTALTVVGVVAAVSLVLVFAGLRDSIDGVFDRQFGAIQREDAEVHAAPGAAGAVLASVRADPDVAAAEPFGRYDVTLGIGDHRYQTLLVALPRETRMHGFTSDGEWRGLPAEGLLLGQGARELLGVAIGDGLTVTVAQTGRQLQERVVGFVDEPMNPVAYIALEHFSAIADTPASSGLLLQLRPDADEEAVAGRLMALSGVVVYVSTATVASAMREAFALYDVLVGLMLAFAAVMAAALLYNAMWANVAERSVELGTLQAAGMGSGALGRLVATENLLLVILGLPLGLVAGALIADWFMSTYATDGYTWHLDMSASTPLLVAAGVLLAALVAQVPALRTIRRMDLAVIVRERSL